MLTVDPLVSARLIAHFTRMQITPGHDPNDYAIGKRRDLPIINIMNKDGTMNAAAGE